MRHPLTIRLNDPDQITKHKTPGFVYFVQGEAGGLIKIGWATKPEVRTRNMQMVCPVRLRILLQVVGNGRMESELHKRFAADRQHGEWFEPDSGASGVN